ncbi:unannotated protein [freshwater metagenome]|uniref:Unannotated protein n=1 Tax=freshwater metagenome TaxID=449393 RepID=A0A6J7GR28_9ZZZZ
MNSWFADYPAEHQHELRRRLGSKRDHEFRSAWFELYLHALHRALEWAAEVHPDLPDTESHPDFRLRRGASVMLLEATAIGDGMDSGRAKRRAQVTDSVEAIASPDFGLILSIEQEGAELPRMGYVRKRVAQWLATLDWEHERPLAEKNANHELLPQHLDKADDWRFSFRAWPRMQAHRGERAPTVVAGPSDGGVFDHGGRLKHALEKKAKKYGATAEPIVIAVALSGMAIGREDVATALFGPTIGVAQPDGNVRTSDRRGDGLWSSSGSPRNTQIAGVLVFGEDLQPWSITRQSPELWLHPEPDTPIPEVPWDQVRLIGAAVVHKRGTFDPSGLFDLPGWPDTRPHGDWPGNPFEEQP